MYFCCPIQFHESNVHWGQTIWNVVVWSRGRSIARRTGSSFSKDWTSPIISGEEFLKVKFGKKKKIGGKGCRLCVIFFWLAGDKVTGWCLGNLSLLVPISLESICLWWAYSHHSPPGWGVLVSVEELRVRHQIVICVPSRATSHPVILLSC